MQTLSGKASTRLAAEHLGSYRRVSQSLPQLQRQAQAVRQIVIKAIAAPSDTDIKHALRNVKPQLLINGKFVDASTGKTFPTENPATRETLLEVAEGSAEDVEAAIDAAREAFDKGPWPRMTGRQRGEVLFKLADLLEENIDELAMLETLDNGKPFKYARTSDLPQAIEHLRYYAGYADKVHGKTIPCNGKMMAYTYREPLGVIGQIIPWNFPILMMAWKIAPALAMGNTIVMKVAEQTPLSALRVGELALDAGLPAGCLNLVLGDGPVAGAALSKSKRIQKLAFTGSTTVGKLIMKQAAENIVPVTLELGGKSPNIICPDANIDEAVEGAHFALFFNMGQCCTAGSRTFVHADIYDEFVEKAKKRAEATNVGDPFGEGTELGPQISKEQVDIILGFVEKGKSEGAKLECGGKMKEGTNGYFLEPTVFSNVTDDMTIAKDEIFGPVMSILKWNTIEEVIQRSNNNEYGLAAGVWTKNLDWMNSLSRGVQSGTIWVNCYDVFDAAVPFGGYKLSGIGREHGDEVLSHYTQVKSVYVPLQEPIGWNQ